MVPMDGAAKEHTAMLCNSNGDILRSPFGVWQIRGDWREDAVGQGTLTVSAIQF